MTQRELFEEWARGALRGAFALDFARNVHDGSYVVTQTANHFANWQSARAAALRDVVKLIDAQPFGSRVCSCETFADKLRDEVRALEAQ